MMKKYRKLRTILLKPNKEGGMDGRKTLCWIEEFPGCYQPRINLKGDVMTTILFIHVNVRINSKSCSKSSLKKVQKTK